MQRQLVALRVVQTGGVAAHERISSSRNSRQQRQQQHWQPPRPRDGLAGSAADGASDSAADGAATDGTADSVAADGAADSAADGAAADGAAATIIERSEQLRGVWAVWHQLSAQRVNSTQSLHQYWQATALTVSIKQWCRGVDG